MATGESSKSYQQIFKATAIIGGSSVINIGLSIVRTKVLAVLLGPGGIGLLGIYNSIVSTATAFAGCGISVSGVRQIAEAQATNDQRKIASTHAALEWSTIALAMLGSLLFFVFREKISIVTFGDSEHSSSIAILSACVFFSVFGASQGALLNGLRKIGDLAKISIVSALITTVLAIVITYRLGESGIVYIILVTAMTTFLLTWYYSNKIEKVGETYSYVETKTQIKNLFKLGFVFMGTEFMYPGTQYLVRILISQKLGIEALGYFHASWSISMLYIGFVLNAMIKDYYPRLTALATDHNAMNQLVNEQSEVALLLSGPLILVLLTFAPLVTSLLYAPSFAAMNPILRWQTIGTVFKIVSWPMGFIVLAKGRGSIFFLTELAWNVLYITGVWLGVKYIGLVSTGIAFFVAYILYGALIYGTASALTGFRLMRKNLIIIVILTACLFGVLILSYISLISSYIVGGLFTIGFGFFSIKSLHHSVGHPTVSTLLSKIKNSLSSR